MFSSQRGENAVTMASRSKTDSSEAYRRLVAADVTQQNALIWNGIAERSMVRSKVKRVAQVMRQQDEAALNERRRSLALLLSVEDASLQLELQAMKRYEGTSIGNQRRTVARALKQREEREAARTAEAQARYRQQYVESSEELRMYESDALAKHVHSVVAQQLQHNAERKHQEAQSEAQWSRTWEEERLRREKADNDAMQQRVAFNRATTQALMAQMDENRERALAQEQKEAEERLSFNAKCAEDTLSATLRAAEITRVRIQESQRDNAANEAARLKRIESQKASRAQEKQKAQQQHAQFLAVASGTYANLPVSNPARFALALSPSSALQAAGDSRFPPLAQRY